MDDETRRQLGRKHDVSVDRTTSGSGDVRQMTLAELRELARFDLYGVATNRPGDLLDAIWEGE